MRGKNLPPPAAQNVSRATHRPPALARPDSPSSPLEKPVQYVRGVGPNRAKLLAALGIATVGDLVEYFPFRYDEQPRPQAIDTLILDLPATVIGVVERVRRRGGFGGPTVNIEITDGTGRLRAAWFNAPHLEERLARGQVLRLYGSVGEYESLGQMVNPTIEWLDPEADPATWDHGRIVPVYPATARLPSQQIARLVASALPDALSAVVDPLPPSVLQAYAFPSRRDAVAVMHQPDGEAGLPAARDARRRLAYEELFMMQLAITLVRRWTSVRAKSPRLPVTPAIDERIRQRFPFSLTAAQSRAIGEITADMGRERPMSRLLQGDVGSGKTAVALYAALVAVANRYQCAILSPTEVLAAQHFAAIERYLAGSRVNRCVLMGRTPAKQREEMLRVIADGSMNLIVGTQALLERQVRFASLGLVIVDEQHKFGVSQRAVLRTRSGPARESNRERFSQMPHYLVMTATPIPRTLSMTVFGDLDVSVIDQLPPGRQPIATRVVRPQDEAEAWRAVRQRIAAGEQVYIVYPLVEESDDLDLRAATREVGRVAHELLPGTRVGLLHGRMKKSEKQSVMRAFAAGQLDALVSTTVIEVGVDVPNATVMIVQHAERYGLSALHQLRGRVGRGTRASLCLLMTDSHGEVARQRLSILCQTTDGFRIAEEDLRIRGPGELLGTRQHGWPEFRVASLVDDVELLMKARDDAARLVQGDSDLRRPEHAFLRAELRRRFRDKVAFIDVG